MNENELIIRTVAEGHYDEEFVTLNCRDLYRIWQGLPTKDDGKDYYYCRATNRIERNGEYLYTAEIYDVVEKGSKERAEVKEVLINVPRDAFMFQDRLYTRE